MLSILIFEATAPSIIHQKNFAVQYLTKVTTSVSADDLNDDSSIDDENLQKLIDNPEEIINTEQMTPEELKNFEEAAQQEAEKADLPTQEDREAYKKTLMDLYDPNSSVYQDLQGATDRLIEEINENHQSVLDKVTSERVLAAKHGTISVKVLAGAINVGLVAVTGGAAGAGVKALVLKVGAKKQQIQLVKSCCYSFYFRYQKVSGIDTVISSIVKIYLIHGTTMAKCLDSRDKIKNNGWLEWW